MTNPNKSGKEQTATYVLKRIEECRKEKIELLDLHGDGLKTLPPEVANLTFLRTLWLHKNQLKTVPPEIKNLVALTRLSLADNQLTILPPEIANITALKELYLHGNEALGMPESVLGPRMGQVYVIGDRASEQPARPADILNFYFAQRHGAATGTLRRVDEIKVMLVGRGGAGKTSLRRFLLGEPHNFKEPETPGIALDTFPLRCGLREVSVRLWDFAGQEITHALHQFFLTEGCVYLLVLDPRSNTEMTDAEYWLCILRRYASGSPVIVVLNHQDARQGGYDVDRRRLEETFPAIRTFVRTNCEIREGCGELRKEVQKAIASLKETEPPHLKVPQAWLRVMRECFEEGHRPEDKRGLFQKVLAGVSHSTTPPKKRQYLTLEMFREICQRHGENQPDKQESLARLLHRLGAVLHFVDEPRLRDTAVLNPHWLTDGVYRLLRYKDRPQGDGTLSILEALQALPLESEAAARFLLRLMERFEMCFPVDEEDAAQPTTKWFIPSALNPFQPQEVGPEWQKKGSVRMRYVYDPLPEGVLPRFIVLTHLLSQGKPRWRNGVVLEDGGAKALIRRGEKMNHVEVIAFGPDDDRLRLLQIVQGTLDRISVDLPDPKPYAEQELENFPGVFRPLADLEAAEQAKQNLPVGLPSGARQTTVAPTTELNRTSEFEARDPERVPLAAFLSYSHEDERVKEIFRQNLTVMKQKKLITAWHDGRIEPGMRWREEIEKSLDGMDIFIGLLTTAFLASEFIQRVELRVARERLKTRERDFQFVLILVDDISLEDLDLAEYQVLKAGGKAVSDYRPKKKGLNIVQKDLEQLIKKWQAEAKQRRLAKTLLGGKVEPTPAISRAIAHEEAPRENV